MTQRNEKTDDLYLGAEELWSKWGFGDGGRVGDLLLDLGIDGSERIGTDSLEDAVLEHLVRTRLLPECPVPVELERWSTSHNPLRSSTFGQEDAPEWAAQTSVLVTKDEVLAAVDVVRAEARV